jgi:acyl carrier protein
MERLEIYDRLGKILRESTASEVDWGTVSEETTIESLGFDSLTILDLLFDIDEEFGLETSAKDILDIGTVGEMVTFLEKRLEGSPAP